MQLRFSEAQRQPRTARAVLLAVVSIFLVQAGYMLLDLAIRRFMAGRLGDISQYIATSLLLSLGAYVGISISCRRYPLADRTAIFRAAVAATLLVGLAGVEATVGEGGLASAFAVQGGYTVAQVLGIWIAVRINRPPPWLTGA